MQLDLRDLQESLEFKALMVVMAKLEETVYLEFQCKAQWGQKVRKALKDKLVHLEMMAIKVTVAFKEFLDIKAPRLYLLQSEKVTM